MFQRQKHKPLELPLGSAKAIISTFAAMLALLPSAYAQNVKTANLDKLPTGNATVNLKQSPAQLSEIPSEEAKVQSIGIKEIPTTVENIEGSPIAAMPAENNNTISGAAEVTAPNQFISSTVIIAPLSFVETSYGLGRLFEALKLEFGNDVKTAVFNSREEMTPAEVAITAKINGDPERIINDITIPPAFNYFTVSKDEKGNFILNPTTKEEASDALNINDGSVVPFLVAVNNNPAKETKTTIIKTALEPTKSAPLAINAASKTRPSTKKPRPLTGGKSNLVPFDAPKQPDLDKKRTTTAQQLNSGQKPQGKTLTGKDIKPSHKPTTNSIGHKNLPAVSSTKKGKKPSNKTPDFKSMDSVSKAVDITTMTETNDNETTRSNPVKDNNAPFTGIILLTAGVLIASSFKKTFNPPSRIQQSNTKDKKWEDFLKAIPMPTGLRKKLFGVFKYNS